MRLELMYKGEQMRNQPQSKADMSAMEYFCSGVYDCRKMEIYPGDEIKIPDDRVGIINATVIEKYQWHILVEYGVKLGKIRTSLSFGQLKTMGY